MGHIHSVYDTDKHFTIDTASRVLLNQNPERNAIMQFDHNSERITFDLPRMVDGHDMLTCNRVQIHYLNIDAQTKDSNPGMYEADDLALSPAGEDTVVCSWLISRNATQLVGPLYFRVTFNCVTGDAPDYSWSTAIYKGLSVADGINNSDWIAEDYPDVLEQWRQGLVESGIYFKPSMSASGDLSWTNNAGLPNPAPVNLTGPRGLNGVAVQTSGYVAFNVTEDGILQCTYSGDAQPNYYINDEGHLIYET